MWKKDSSEKCTHVRSRAIRKAAIEKSTAHATQLTRGDAV
jgi:hypothetical protein